MRCEAVLESRNAGRWRASFQFLLSSCGGIRLCSYPVARYQERHEILADEERAAIQGTDTGFQLIIAGAWDINAAHQRNMREHSLLRTNLIQDAADHFGIC